MKTLIKLIVFAVGAVILHTLTHSTATLMSADSSAQTITNSNAAYLSLQAFVYAHPIWSTLIWSAYTIAFAFAFYPTEQN